MMIKKLTRGQMKAHASNAAKGRIHWNMARACSHEGLNKEDAAARVGLTINGFNGLLRRNTGAQLWPLEGDR